MAAKDERRTVGGPTPAVKIDWRASPPASLVIVGFGIGRLYGRTWMRSSEYCSWLVRSIAHTSR